ncbi:MAG: UbiA prenyltransferase family protein [Chitinispirillaceae bacterium]|nr:UbiA prenyltransferase family protein [Chitinispirillaceae bacterium]
MKYAMSTDRSGNPLMLSGRTSIKKHIVGFLKLFRINRTVMVAALTGIGARAAGAPGKCSLLMTIAGFLLATGGFSMDFVADRHLDCTGPRARIRLNPVSAGEIPVAFGWTFSSLFLLASLLLTAWISPPSLIPWVVIAAVILGLAFHLFETAIMRGLTLGLLQALYAVMGAMAGSLTPGVYLLAAMFFVAMFGGRAVTDIRDFLQDQHTPVETFPKKYGLKRTVFFACSCLVVSFALSFAVYLTGEYNTTYLYIDLVYIALGILLTTLLALRPTPKVAQFLTYACMMGLGSLISIAVILGRTG